MAEQLEWTSRNKNPEPVKTQEQLDYDIEYKKYGSLDSNTIEMMLIGHLVTTGHAPETMKTSTIDADKILNADVKPEWFYNETLKSLFADVLEYYKEQRERCTQETYREMFGATESPDRTRARAELVMKCYASVLTKKGYLVDILIKRLRERYLEKKAEELYKTFKEDIQIPDSEKKSPPKMGISKAIEKFRSEVITQLSDSSGAALAYGSMIDDFDRNLFDLLDMKEHPEKYVGHQCGINYIDEVTQGFVAGQLTTLVGANGGYKTSTMMNIALGCWRRGLNVLYATLEMNRDLIQKRLMAMGARINARRIRSGQISSPDDMDKLEALKKELLATNDPEKQAILQKKISRLGNILSYLTGPGRPFVPEMTDEVQLRKFMEERKKHPNELIVMSGNKNANSNKIKFSQIEAWIKEQKALFRPDIVIVDYLGLVEAETPTDVRAQDLGDICKHMRKAGANMGFHVITAAQYSRKAFERIRKYGFDSPEKADLSTDDIADSSGIGNDSDFVMMLWSNKATGKIKFMNVKNRHGEKLPDADLTVDGETGVIGSADINVDTTATIAQTATLGDMYASVSKFKGKNMPETEAQTEDDLLGLSESSVDEEADDDYQSSASSTKNEPSDDGICDI